MSLPSIKARVGTPPAVRVNAGAPFPVLVEGSGPITVTKANGIWTIGYDVSGYPLLNPAFDPTSKYVLVFDPVTGLFYNLTIANLFASVLTGSVLHVTAAGTVTVGPGHTAVLIEKAAPSATPIILPSILVRSGLPLHVADINGNGSGDVTPLGAEKIMGVTGAAAWPFQSNGLGMGAAFTLTPSTDINGWYV